MVIVVILSTIFLNYSIVTSDIVGGSLVIMGLFFVLGATYYQEKWENPQDSNSENNLNSKSQKRKKSKRKTGSLWSALNPSPAAANSSSKNEKGDSELNLLENVDLGDSDLDQNSDIEMK